MIKGTVLLLLIVSIYSCAGKTHYPKGVMKQQQMQEVLWDMLKADAIASEIVRTDSSIKLTTKNIELYKKVFIAHKITRNDFELSYSFYEKHPELMRVLLDSMNAERDRKSAIINRPPYPIDSSKI